MVIDLPCGKYPLGAFVQSRVVSHEEGKDMRKVLSLFLLCVLGYALIPNLTEAAQQRVTIKLTGRYCRFHIFDLAESLKRVSGVIDVDFETLNGHVIVVMKAGKVNPDHLLSAVQQVKGDGYSCNGKFNGEPGRIEY
jgi:mercuric ion binding protein